MMAPGVRWTDRHLNLRPICRSADPVFAPTALCQVDHGKPKTDTLNNPSSDMLVGWLRQISSWSNVHPTHSPITVGLDIKHTFPTAGAPPPPTPPDGHASNFGAPVLIPRPKLLPPPPLRPLCHAHRAHCHCARGRAGLDAMVRTEFLNTFTPAELAAHRKAQGDAGWPLVDHMRGKVRISPYNKRTLHPPSPQPLSFYLTICYPHRAPISQPHTTTYTPQVLFVLTGDISTRVAYLDDLEDVLYNTLEPSREPTNFSGAIIFSEYSPGDPEALKEATLPPPTHTHIASPAPIAI